LSCGAETTEANRHPVTYKSIIKHFEHVMAIAKEMTSYDHKTLKFPPNEEIINAAGQTLFASNS
jgi:hypothetical protein